MSTNLSISMLLTYEVLTYDLLCFQGSTFFTFIVDFRWDWVWYDQLKIRYSNKKFYGKVIKLRKVVYMLSRNE